MIVELADLASWQHTTIAPDDQPTAERAIRAGEAWVRRETGLYALEKTDFEVFLDGASAVEAGTTLLLPGLRPLWHLGPDLVSVWDTGVSLPVDADAATASDVVVLGANRDAPAKLYRLAGWPWWQRGLVRVTGKAGWDPDPEAATLPIPEDIRGLVLEVAWLFYVGYKHVGSTNVSRANAAITVNIKLSPISQMTVDRLQED